MDRTPSPRAPHAPARRAALALLVASVTLSIGCAGQRMARLDDGNLHHARVSASSAHLGELELSSSRLPAGLSLYDAIVRLRPQYLSRSASPTVFVNGMLLQSLEELSGIRADEVLDVRFIRGTEAEELLGSRVAGRAWVIMVRLAT